MATYSIIRFFQGEPSQVIKTGLTLEEAEAHTADPETSSSTATSPEAMERTYLHGPWFDGFTEE